MTKRSDEPSQVGHIVATHPFWLTIKEIMMEAKTQSSLVASGNTYNPSLLVLRDKGYDLWLEKSEEGSLWCARKGLQHFLAYSGPELLGLVTLWEHYGENWNKQNPNIYEYLIENMKD